MPSSPPSDIYALSLHDALPICRHAGRGAGGSRHALVRPRQPCPIGAAGRPRRPVRGRPRGGRRRQRSRLRPLRGRAAGALRAGARSEEHTSELQSRLHGVCRLRPPPTSTLFPYTTLFRSVVTRGEVPGGADMPWYVRVSHVRSGPRAGRVAQFEVAHEAGDDASDLVFGPFEDGRQARYVLERDRKSTRLNSSHGYTAYAVFAPLRHLRSFPTRRSSDLSSRGERCRGEPTCPGTSASAMSDRGRGPAASPSSRSPTRRATTPAISSSAPSRTGGRRATCWSEIGRAHV